MKRYDDEQLHAIEASGGHHLVLAPPGCGKTDILSERIVFAHERGVPFDDMLCLTFTNRASRGMRERVRERVGAEAAGVFVGNVHRYCSNLIYGENIVAENTSIIDEDDMADMLQSIDIQYFTTPRGLPDKKRLTAVDNLDAYISQREMEHPDEAIYLPRAEYEPHYQAAKAAGLDPEKVPATEPLVKYTLLFRREKASRGLLTFSDILVQAYEALRSDSERRLRRYPWIQVDEVQDLNALQTAIIDQLTDTSGDYTVMYLGDEQQAIFSFLGAKLGQLERLKERCKGHIHALGTNYRSPRHLLDLFNRYAHEELGVSDALLPHSLRDEPHDKHDLLLVENESAEAEEQRVPDMVRHYLSHPGERVALLVPTNNAADRISRRLTAAGLSHFKISGTDLFKSQSFKTLAAFLCVSVNPFNHLAWARLLHGVGALRTSTLARRFASRCTDLMMTPADLFHGKSYVARFDEAYQRSDFVFFDTETTGLDVLNDDIVQIAAFKVSRGLRVEGSDLNIFLHTDKPIPAMLGSTVNPLPEAYAAASHYSREEGLRLFLKYVGDSLLLGHNVTFDYNILRHNVARTLGLDIHFDTYDSLRLIKSVSPHLRMYKLGFLLQELRLTGQNSHLADEDIAATKALVDYCHEKSLGVLPSQQAFATHPMVADVAEQMSALRPLFARLGSHLHQPISQSRYTLVDALRDIHGAMVERQMIDSLGDKFEVFLRFVESEWAIDGDSTLYEQIGLHANDLMAGINEGDLVQSQELIDERVFIMTVYKGKGLEFDNVVVLEANDGTYPFFTVNNVLLNPSKYSEAAMSQARQERMEDARKFYVALSRAKRRLCISWSRRNSYGIENVQTPFLKSILHYLHSGRR